ncbi:helix-turn-helix transcriptional regulator [Actinomadura sp. NPDC023710]|uniref:helix-turn-helix transcriptional regulator n=1 Tax=Actinomadura sp. NPDC023710 TaxID=3158219 RepID=UPI0033F97659
MTSLAPGSWERGDRCPSLERTYTYAAALGMAPVLLAGSGGWVPVPLAACSPDERRPPVLRQLRATRLARDLPVVQVAAALGVATVTLSMTESGERRVQLDQAHAYADILGMVLTVEEIAPTGAALVEASGAVCVRRAE